MEARDAMRWVGFTGQETELYIVLCREGALTGYEAAKLAGISRSNAYPALAGLAEKGAAWLLEGDPARYAAVPPLELIVNLQRRAQAACDAIATIPVGSLPREAFVTVQGFAAVTDRMKNLIGNASARIYASMAPEQLDLARNELENAVKRGLKVVLITSPGYTLSGSIIHHRTKTAGAIRLIADSTEVLTGDLAGEHDSGCIYSRHPGLVSLIKESLTNEMQLISSQHCFDKDDHEG